MRTALYFTLIPALLPVFLILRYIYRLDKNEREPLPFVLFVLVMGALFALPCGAAESFLMGVFSSICDTSTVKYAWLENTLGVALVEEFSKWLVMMIFVWRNRNFDYRYDGIVYAVSASLGFAALENILYIIQFGTGVAWGRALFAIPGHTTFAVFMGYYMSRAKSALLESKPASLRKYKLLALVIPMLIHGMYDFLLSDQVGQAGFDFSFLIFVALLDIIAWIIIKHEFRTDRRLD